MRRQANTFRRRIGWPALRMPDNPAMKCLGVALTLWVAAGVATVVCADEVEKVLFLVVEETGVVASNTLTGRIERLELRAKERIEDSKAANAVAVVVTNQRYVAYGVIPGGWRSVRRRAQEETESVEVGDYSATVVTSDRILNFYGRRGAWSEVPRSVK
jgi:hypothetical protein